MKSLSKHIINIILHTCHMSCNGNAQSNQTICRLIKFAYTREDHNQRDYVASLFPPHLITLKSVISGGEMGDVAYYPRGTIIIVLPTNAIRTSFFFFFKFNGAMRFLLFLPSAISQEFISAFFGTTQQQEKINEAVNTRACPGPYLFFRGDCRSGIKCCSPAKWDFIVSRHGFNQSRVLCAQSITS